MENINIYIYTHKNFTVPVNNDSYIVLKSDNFRIDCPIRQFSDNTLNNISGKQYGYCECSGMYWIWKNRLKSSKYIGINHYRRYFNFMNDIPNLDKIFQEYNVIVGNVLNVNTSLLNQYNMYHCVEDLNLIYNIINDLCPEYIDSWNKYINNNNFTNIYCNNVFILSSDEYDKYCEWLFSILFEFDKRLNIKTTEDIKQHIKTIRPNLSQYYINIQSRLQGYISERLFTLYIMHNNFKIKHIPLVNLG